MALLTLATFVPALLAQRYMADKEIGSPDELLARLKADQGCTRSVTPAQMRIVTEDRRQIEEWAAGASQERVSAAAANAVTTLATSENEQDRICAAHLLLDVTVGRPDSAAVLRKDVNTIGAVLNGSDDERLQRSTGAMLTMLRPEPPVEIILPLLQFLTRADRDPNIQASAVGPLSRVAPHDPAVVSAIQEFWSRPLNIQSKISVLNGLGTARPADERLVGIVVAALQDPEPGVQFTAVQVISRMGKDAIRQGASALHKLVEPPQPNEHSTPQARLIRQLARDALATVEHQ